VISPIPELDRADLRMLALLQAHGRISNVELAQRVALSPSPCLRRLQRLEEIGVIARYAAVLDPKMLGLGLIAHLELMLDKRAEHARSTLRTAVTTWPEVMTCYALSGQWDYSLHVITQDLEHYSRFLMEKVLALPVVVNVQSSFVLETVKATTALPLGHLGVA
jgi:Lrp/AsnC family leucine-responsive transcriptional regulator